MRAEQSQRRLQYTVSVNTVIIDDLATVHFLSLHTFTKA